MISNIYNPKSDWAKKCCDCYIYIYIFYFFADRSQDIFHLFFYCRFIFLCISKTFWKFKTLTTLSFSQHKVLCQWRYEAMKSFSCHFVLFFLQHVLKLNNGKARCCLFFSFQNLSSRSFLGTDKDCGKVGHVAVPSFTSAVSLQFVYNLAWFCLVKKNIYGQSMSIYLSALKSLVLEPVADNGPDGSACAWSAAQLACFFQNIQSWQSNTDSSDKCNGPSQTPPSPVTSMLALDKVSMKFLCCTVKFWVACMNAAPYVCTY